MALTMLLYGGAILLWLMGTVVLVTLPGLAAA